MEDIEGIRKELEELNKRLSRVEKAVGIEKEKPAEEIEVAEEAPAAEIKEKITELDIGRRWFNKLGIISLVIGIIFFIKYSFERGLLGPVAKITLGILAGLLLLVVGEFFDRKEKYRNFARSLTGGSFAILYITIFAAHELYNLIPKYASIGVLGVIVFLAIVFSLRYNSKVIVSEAFFLGYLISLMTPITTYTLIYNAVLTAGLIIIAQRRSWEILGAGGLAAGYLILSTYPVAIYNFVTTGIFLIIYFILLAYLITGIKNKVHSGYIGIAGLLVTYILYLRFPQNLENFAATSIFLIIYFLCFTFLSFILKEEKKLSIALTLSNAAFFYGLFYTKLDRSYTYNLYLSLFTIGVAAACLTFGYVAANKQIKSLLATYLGLCITFITLTVPVQVNYELVTISWAIEALLLLILGFRFDNRNLRLFSAGIGALAIGKAILVDSNLRALDIQNILASTRFFAFLVPIITFYLSSTIYHKNRERIEKIEVDIGQAYVIGGTLLTAVLLALELERGWISTAWAVQAIVLLVLGFRYKNKLLRILGLGLLAVTTLKVFILDLAGLKTTYRILSFIVLGIILLVASFVYSKYRDIFEDEGKNEK